MNDLIKLNYLNQTKQNVKNGGKLQENVFHTHPTFVQIKRLLEKKIVYNILVVYGKLMKLI